MNYHLFSAFLLITFILVIVPGPIVTLVISTGATRGIRAALMTVLGSTLGNAVLITAIALGLNWICGLRRKFLKSFAGQGRPIWSGSVSRPGVMPGNRERSRRHAIASTFPVASWWP